MMQYRSFCSSSKKTIHTLWARCFRWRGGGGGGESKNPKPPNYGGFQTPTTKAGGGSKTPKGGRSRRRIWLGSGVIGLSYDYLWGLVFANLFSRRVRYDDGRKQPRLSFRADGRLRDAVPGATDWLIDRKHKEEE